MRTSRVGLLHVCQNLLCIALQITNSHVYLSKRHSKGYDIHEKIPFSSECVWVCKVFSCCFIFHLDNGKTTEGRYIGDVHDKSAPTDILIRLLQIIIKGVSLNGDAVISVARRAIHRYSVPGVSAFHSPTWRSNIGFTRGWANHGCHKRAIRSHSLLCFILALYRQWADLAVTSTFVYYTNSDFRRTGLPVGLAFLAHTLALVRHITAGWSSHFWFCSRSLRCYHTHKLCGVE